MTTVDRIVTLLRDRGAAYCEFDDSATDGQCWIVERRDDWYRGLAVDILAVATPPPACGFCGQAHSDGDHQLTRFTDQGRQP